MVERGRNLQNNIFVIDSEQQYKNQLPIAKEFYFSTSVITILSNVLCFSYAKRVEYRYNHNAKFSLHAKMSVVTFSFIIHKVSSGQPGKFHRTILLYSPCSISYRSLLLLTLLMSLIFCFIPLRHFYKNHCIQFYLTV